MPHADVIGKIKKLIGFLNPNLKKISINHLNAGDELDLFTYNRILSISDTEIDPNLTIEKLREHPSYPHYMIKKMRFNQSENKAILFNKHGIALGEFTLYKSPIHSFLGESYSVAVH